MLIVIFFGAHYGALSASDFRFHLNPILGPDQLTLSVLNTTNQDVTLAIQDEYGFSLVMYPEAGVSTAYWKPFDPDGKYIVKVYSYRGWDDFSDLLAEFPLRFDQ